VVSMDTPHPAEVPLALAIAIVAAWVELLTIA
jgi:hypothetical protein